MARDKDIELVDSDEDLEDEIEEDEYEDDEDIDGRSASAVVGFVTGLLVGVVVGAGVALLIAPDRGDVTRRRLRSRFHDLQDDARDKLASVRDETGRRARRGPRRLRRRRSRR